MGSNHGRVGNAQGVGVVSRVGTQIQAVGRLGEFNLVGACFVHDLNLIETIDPQANHGSAGKGHMAHQVVPVITGQHDLPAAFVWLDHWRFKYVKIGVLTIAANDQTPRCGAIPLMIHIVLVAGATRGNYGGGFKHVISWHESHFAGDVVACTDEHQLFGLRQSQTNKKRLVVLFVQ